MYLPDELDQLARRFIANPKKETARMLIGVVILLLSIPILHLFLNGTFALADFLNSF